MSNLNMPTNLSVVIDDKFQWVESPDCMYLIDAESQRTVAVNHPLWQRLGYKMHEVEMPHAAVPQQFLHDGDKILVKDFFTHLNAMTSTDEYRRHLRFRTKTGSWKTFCLRINRYQPGEKIFLGVITNISPEKGSYVRAQRKASWAATENRRLDNLLLELCHDVRAPLQTVLLLSSKMNRALADGDGSNKKMLAECSFLLNNLKETTAQIHSTLNSILARRKGGSRRLRTSRPLELRKLFAQIKLEADLRTNLGFTKIVAAVDPSVPEELFVPGNDLYQILTNLVLNAIRHADARNIRISASYSEMSGTLRTMVTDDGKGIHASQAKAAGADSGIGLSICRRLMKESGGTMQVSSGDEGTTVSISLPAFDGNTDDNSQNIHNTRLLSSPFKLLVLDDDPFSLALISMFSSSLGGQCIARDDVYTAIHSGPLNGRRFDAVLIGSELAKREDAVSKLNAAGLGERIYIMGDMGPEWKNESRVQGFLQKPIEKNQIAMLVKTWATQPNRRLTAIDSHSIQSSRELGVA